MGRCQSAHRPSLWANRVRQITGVMHDGGGISEYYAQLYSAFAERAPLIGAVAEHPMRWQAAEHRDVVANPIDRMGYFALLGTLSDGTLTKWDRAGMAHSLEVRVPFLDHRVVELAWRLRPALKYDRQGGSKRLLRRILYRYVPPELVDRPKKGFSSPLPVWLRGPLRPWAEPPRRAEAAGRRHLRPCCRARMLESAPRRRWRPLAAALVDLDVSAMAMPLGAGSSRPAPRRARARVCRGRHAA